MISISTKDELSLYNLEGKWNDYIYVQKEVLRVLREQNFFATSNVLNIESGLCIRITTKGIRETLGNGNRFKKLPKHKYPRIIFGYTILMKYKKVLNYSDHLLDGNKEIQNLYII